MTNLPPIGPTGNPGNEDEGRLTDRVTASSNTPDWLRGGRPVPPRRRPRPRPNPTTNPNPGWNPNPTGGTVNLLKVLETASIGTPVRRGGLALYPVYLHGDQGLAIEPRRDLLEVLEQGSATVPSVQVLNPSQLPALLVEGETISGGLQDRCVNVSILVPAGGRVDVPVSCIERGRWGGGHHGFTRHGTFAPRRVRRTKTATVGDAFRMSAARLSDQGAVWSSVDHELDRVGADAPSRTMLAAEERLDDEHFHLVEELAGMGPLPGQRGIVVGVGSRIVSADLFASTELLAANWRALVRGYLLDAMDAERSPSKPGAALRFLHRLAHAQAEVGRGVGLGDELHLRSRSVVGQALTFEGNLVHASAYAVAA